ncbi:MAG: hypothetical protein ACT4NL_06560 [Pseudomarimonas sp.]
MREVAEMRRRRLACVFAADIEGQYAAGNWKDIQGINALLPTLGVEVLEVPLTVGSVREVTLVCSEGVSDLLIHYSYWSTLISEIRKAFPHIRIHTRAHNAEALQHLHRYAPGLLPTTHNLKGWYGAARNWQREAHSRWMSDSLWCISEWDRRRYQRFLPGRAHLVDVPYHCPWPALRSAVKPAAWANRRNAMACLAGGRDRIGLSQRDGLVKFAREVTRLGLAGDWSFEISAGVHRGRSVCADLAPLREVGEVAEPWDLLCGTKVLALITPLGYGCKTTIIDALSAGCHVLIDQRLVARLPAAVASLCVVLDTSLPSTFASAFERVQREPQPNQVNDSLIVAAKRGLKTALHLTPRASPRA